MSSVRAPARLADPRVDRGAARTRGGSGPGAGHTWVLALLGAVVNLIVVTVVGFIQGGWAPLLVLFAIEAGIAVLIGAAIVVPIVHRLVKPPVTGSPAT